MDWVAITTSIPTVWVPDTHPHAAFIQRSIVEEVVGRLHDALDPLRPPTPRPTTASRQHGETRSWSVWKKTHAVHLFDGGVLWWRTASPEPLQTVLSNHHLPPAYAALAHHRTLYVAMTEGGVKNITHPYVRKSLIQALDDHTIAPSAFLAL